MYDSPYTGRAMYDHTHTHLHTHTYTHTHLHTHTHTYAHLHTHTHTESIHRQQLYIITIAIYAYTRRLYIKFNIYILVVTRTDTAMYPACWDTYSSIIITILWK